MHSGTRTHNPLITRPPSYPHDQHDLLKMRLGKANNIKPVINTGIYINKSNMYQHNIARFLMALLGENIRVRVVDL